MTLDRRQIMLAGIGIGAGTAVGAGPRTGHASPALAQPAGLPATDLGLRPDTDSDQTALLQTALDTAHASGVPLHLPAGRYRTRGLKLRAGLHLIGVPGRTILSMAGQDGLLAAQGTTDVRIEGLTLDGGRRPLGPAKGLLDARTCVRLMIRDCRVQASARHGLALEQCSGAVSDCEIVDVAQTGLFSLDGTGLEVHHNLVRDCANNGIQIWRTQPGEDGTIVTANRIQHIRSDDGGSGQNGNGINLFRAGAVLVTGNRIEDCAFTAVRANAASNCQIVANSCARLGEVALYAEFGFEGSVIASNIVDHAAAGISITNFNEGGRLAVAQGNLIRNLFLRDHAERRGFGIGVEADTLVNGNVVEDAPSVGINAGWGRHMRDVTITANLVRRARIGIAVSASPGAGYALVTNNMVTGSAEGAIRAMDHDRPLGRDLVHSSAEAYRNLAVYGNVGL